MILRIIATSVPTGFPVKTRRGRQAPWASGLRTAAPQALKGELTHERARKRFGRQALMLERAPQREARSSSNGAVRSPRGRGSERCSPPPWRCGSRPSRCSASRAQGALRVCSAAMASGVVCDLQARMIRWNAGGPVGRRRRLSAAWSWIHRHRGGGHCRGGGSGGVLDGEPHCARWIGGLSISALGRVQSLSLLGAGDVGSRCRFGLVAVTASPWRRFVHMAGGGDDGARMRMGSEREVVPLGWFGVGSIR